MRIARRSRLLFFLSWLAPALAPAQQPLGVPAGQGYPGTDYAGDAQFGTAVALGNGLLAISAPNLQLPPEGTTGAVFVYRLDQGDPVFLERLIAPGPYEVFGSALEFGPGQLAATSVERVYVWDTDDFGRSPDVVELTAPGPRALALHSGRIAVGVPQQASEQGSGEVHVLERAPDGGWLRSRLPRGVANAQAFGAAVAMGPDWIAVGSPLDDGPNAPDDLIDAGNVYVYRWLESRWQCVQTIAGTGNGAQLGATLATDGTRVFVGAPQWANRGAVFVYETAESGLRLVAQWAPEAGPAGARFGYALDTEGAVAAIGAPGERSVYRYDALTEGWRRRRVGAPADSPVDFVFGDFGSRLAIGEASGLLVSTPYADDRARPGTTGEGRAWFYSQLFADSFE